MWAQRGFDASPIVAAVQRQLKAIALAVAWLWDNHRQWLHSKYAISHAYHSTRCMPPRLAYTLGAGALLTALATAVANLWAMPQLNAHVLPTVTSTAAVALQRDVRCSHVRHAIITVP